MGNKPIRYIRIPIDEATDQAMREIADSERGPRFQRAFWNRVFAESVCAVADYADSHGGWAPLDFTMDMRQVPLPGAVSRWVERCVAAEAVTAVLNTSAGKAGEVP